MRRAVPAEAMLARLAPLRPAIGVTRLAVLTGLDMVGIPVAAAIRPNSRTVAVHQGKGATLAQAKVSALMEALECCCAETQMLPLRLGTAAELARLGEVAPLAQLPRCRAGPDPAEARLLWVEARCLVTGRAVWLPRELVAADFAVPVAPCTGYFQATTNGLASGGTAREATLAALFEVIERDAVTLWHAGSPARQARGVVDPASIDGPLSRALLERCRAAGLRLTVWEVTSDVGVPAFVVLLADPGRPVQPELGAACRLDADAALAGAVAEAAQARLTTISGARDDYLPESFSPRVIAEQGAVAAELQAAPPTRRFADAPAAGDADPLDTVLGRLTRAGFGQALCVPLTRDDLGVPVARVVVPGLEGPWNEAGGEFAPGPRARALLAEA